MGMSELTPCNYCNLQEIKRNAKKKGFKVTKLSGDFGLGGVDVFAHPKNVKIDPKDEEQREKYFRAWMMEISDSCCC